MLGRTIKNIFVFLFVISFVKSVRCQSIQTDIDVNFLENDSLILNLPNYDSEYVAVNVRVTEIFSLNDWVEDSIELSVEKPNIWAQFVPYWFFDDIHLFYRETKDDNWDSIYFDHSYLKIRCPVNSSNCQLKIVYSHLPYAMFLYRDNLPHFNAILHTLGGWYYSHPLTTIRTVKTTIPLSGYTLFLNKQAVIIGNQTHLIDFTKADDNEFSAILIKDDWYQKQAYADEKYRLNLYHWDSTFYVFELDTIRLHYPICQETMKKRMELMKMSMERFCSFFPTKKSLMVNIVDNNLVKDDVVWGCAFQEKKRDTMSVFLDSQTGWDGNTVQHEILHGYLDILPPKEDSAYFFFCEAMTEYLSVALFNSQEETDSILRHAYTYYLANRRESDGESIFNLREDFMRRDFSGTALIIYHKTPLAIHNFGVRIGGQRQLLQILKQFYTEVSYNDRCSFSFMKEVFLNNGITDPQWEQFVYDLSHNF